MTAKPHILFITSWFPTAKSSAGTFVELHLIALQSRGCKCSVLLSGEVTLGNYAAKLFRKSTFYNFRKRADIAYIENLTVHKLPLRMYSDPKGQRKKNLLSQAEKSIGNYIVKNGKPDVIFHHGVFDYCYLTNHIRNVFDLPVWYMENSPNISANHIPCANDFDTMKSQIEFAQSADRRFAVTDAYVQRMTTLFGVPYEYCPNVITDDFYIEPSAIRKPEGKFRFINVAILNERKNQKLILDAFAHQFKGKDTYELIIAGDGPLLEQLRSKAKELGIDKQCEIMGFQSRKRIVELLDSSHCFVLSSHSETFGVVIIEAMARGLPAISSRIDGPVEIINEINGYFFEPNNADDLAEKMAEMVQNYQSFQPEAIIDSVKQRFGPDAVKNALCPNV